MYLKLYKRVLRLRNFKGRHRLDGFLRSRLLQSPELAPGGVRMFLDPQEWLQIDLMRGSATEPKTAALFERLLRPGDTLVDIGAHVGWLSLIGAKVVGPRGVVIAIDPQPYNCDRILRNAQANGFENLTVVAGAVGAKAGPVRLSNQSEKDKARLTLQGVGVNDTGVGFLTQVYSIPELLDVLGLRTVRLMKVDVEGFEAAVFRGAVPVLADIENIVFERLPDSAKDFEAIRALLAEAGFELFTVEGEPLGSANPPENNIWARRQA